MSTLFEAVDNAFESLKESGDLYKIDLYQIKDVESIDYAFMGWDKAEGSFSFDHYEKVDTYEVTGDNVFIALEQVFYASNMSTNQTHRSISTSDVFIINGEAFYVDAIGYKKIPDEKLPKLTESIEDKVYLIYSDCTILVTPDINDINAGVSDKFESIDEMVQYFREHKDEFEGMDIYEECGSESGETSYELSDINNI